MHNIQTILVLLGAFTVLRATVTALKCMNYHLMRKDYTSELKYKLYTHASVFLLQDKKDICGFPFSTIGTTSIYDTPVTVIIKRGH